MIAFFGGRLRVARSMLALAAVAATLVVVAVILYRGHAETAWITLAAVAATAAYGALLLQRQVASRETATGAMQDAQARVTDVLEAAMDPVVVVDARQSIVLFNAAAERVFGWPRDAVIGRPLDMLIPHASRAAHGGYMRDFGATGTTARRMGRLRVLSALRADGTEFPIEASISHHREHGDELYTAIVRDVTERVRNEAELRQSQQELKALALAAHQTREDEQRRIARELHDELGQSITALKMMVAAMQAAADARDDKDRARLARMQGLLDETFASIRRMTSELRPLILDDLGLAPALERLAEGFAARSGIACELAIDGSLALDDTARTALYRIVQESLTNVARHAGATRVAVTIAAGKDALVLDVRDDGAGFDIGAPRRSESRGLIGMRERAQLLGGTLAIHSAPGAGTRLAVSIPLARGGAA